MLSGSRIAPEGYPEHGEQMSRVERGPTRHQPSGRSSYYVDKPGHHIPPDEVLYKIFYINTSWYIYAEFFTVVVTQLRNKTSLIKS